MDKESSVISRIKNRIVSIISRLRGKTGTIISEDLKQLIVREKELKEDSGEKKKITPSIGEAIKQLINREKKLEESRAATLNRIYEGITGLEEEYDKRLKGLERSREAILNKLLDGITGLDGEYDKRFRGLEVSIDDLRKEIAERPVIDFISTDEDLKRVRDVVETVMLIPEENLDMMAKITMKTPEIEELRERIEKLKKTADELKTGIGLYIPNDASGEKKTIVEIIESIIKKMRENGDDISEDLLGKIDLTLRLAILISEKNIEPFKTPINLSGDIMSTEYLEGMSSLINEKLKPFKTELLYQKGIGLLKKKAYTEAKECFMELTIMSPNLKGAWLNRGVASGELGDFEDEITCYSIIERKIDPNYKKARHNKKIAERKKRTHRVV